MINIENRLTKALRPIFEEKHASWKDPYSSSYDRQWAEDALYHTIGPLTDNPTWVDLRKPPPKEGEDTRTESEKTGWNNKLSGNPPVPEFEADKPAPGWTPEEIVFAMAGDPSMFGKASGNPRSPGYGPGGGSPLYRLARKLAGIYNRERDKDFAEELYMNGLLQLTKMMQPGFDEHRSAFIPFVMRSIESAMGHGTGGGREESRAGGGTSEFFVNPEGQIRDRLPSGGEEEEEEEKEEGGEEKKKKKKKKRLPKGWRRVQVTGIKQILKIKDPEELRKAAEVVQGEYQKKRAYDKHPDNPFGPFSPAYYQKVNQYADALESKNPDKIEAAQSQLRQLLDEIEDAGIQIRGASTGAGSAISTLDRAKDPRKDTEKALSGLKTGQTANIFGIEIRKVGEDQFNYPWLDARGEKHTSVLTLDEVAEAIAAKRNLGVRSMDVPSKDDEGTAAGNIAGTPAIQTIDPESLEYVLEICLLYNIGEILKNSEKYNKMAFELGADAKKSDPTKANIGGKMTPQELRFIIRRLGNIGQHYPGKGVIRANLHIPRDGKKGPDNWLEPGEDPEIEPLPTVTEAAIKWEFDGGDHKRGDGLWHSWWSSNDYPELGPLEISNEMTMETKKFLKLGIPTARGDRVKRGSPALSKVAASATATKALVKLEIISDIHSDQVKNTVDESIRRLPIVESARALDQIDRDTVVATCRAIIRKLDESIEILEKSPPGWKGTVKAMKKHKDIDNPFALAWSMKKKGTKPHYQDKDGPPKKKKKYASEGMQPIESIIDNE